MSKAEHSFRMEWQNDIPVFKGIEPNIKWQEISWKKLERRVFKLQKRIYTASQRGDLKTVHKLQKLLIKSWSAKCIAVKTVTQENQGKNTTGVDRLKSLRPEKRLTLVKKLRPNTKFHPTPQTWTPKPEKEQKHSLGVRTIYDTALQTLLKMALEPEWEAKFEPNSYGFRPGRSSHDAIEAIYNAIVQNPKYVLDADIANCFHRINHEYILKKLNTFPTMRKQVKAWLKSGVVDDRQLFPTEKSTPQRKTISPLLSNIALHGLEHRINQVFPAKTLKQPKTTRTANIFSPNLIRYADYFVVMHKDLDIVLKCQEVISEWLSEVGLKLQPQKTKITHTLHQYEGNVGFDFLGFNIRQFPVRRRKSNHHPHSNQLAHKTLITPSSESLKNHTKKLGQIIDQHKAATQSALIGKLNPVIQVWAGYYSTVVRDGIFGKIDTHVHSQLRAWAQRRHANKGKGWTTRKYWSVDQAEVWRFSAQHPNGKIYQLIKHQDVNLIRHIKVQGTKSPYDGDWTYWASRIGKYPQLPNSIKREISSLWIVI
ncbi:reverse transcriptase domain-containing protein [Umezakia ovalisporum]|uniref:reverse transcriptase domain-containing protein n=1 Tax=Umezakia ovalisporum TaxID=75695 RepID=UPI0024740FEC|nr:reverse transcriptase domain-containing protein [Umezakia ovalisporum]MDH6066466.1 reverse transcriptase domain-containing protein [Umezakia ovalisporum APH033B]